MGALGDCGTAVRFRTRNDVGPDGGERIFAELRAWAKGRRWWCGAPIFWTERHPNKANRRRLAAHLVLRFGWADAAADDAFMASRDLRTVLDALVDKGVAWDVLFPGGFKSARIEGGLGADLLAVVRQLADQGGATGDERVDAARAERLFVAHDDRYRDAPPLLRGGALVHRVAELKAAVHLELVPASLALEAEIRRIPRSGELRLRAWSTVADDVRMVADRAAAEVELTPIGDAWAEVDRPSAETRMTHWLRFDLAYPTAAAQMDEEAAAGFVARFLALCDGTAKILVCDPWDREDGMDGIALGGHIFDAGLAVVVPGRCVGIFWIGVED